VPERLHRYYGSGYLHFITSSCYQRRPLLDTSCRRNLFLEILEQVRRRYSFVVVGYVLMPEHLHLLISEPQRSNPSIVMQVLKQRYAHQVLAAWRTRQQSLHDQLWQSCMSEGHFWQRRFYDFVVYTERKRVEKLRYMHRNPVKRGLVLDPGQWPWSSFRYYAYGECGEILINEQQPAEMRVRNLSRTDLPAAG
jgi:putative transposase